MLPYELACRVNLESLERDLDNLWRYGIFGGKDDLDVPISLLHPNLIYAENRIGFPQITLFLNTIELRFLRNIFLDPRAVIPSYSLERRAFIVAGIPKEAIVAVCVPD